MALTAKQMRVIELLTCGNGRNYNEIAKEVDISVSTIYRWRTAPEFSEFQERLKEVQCARWDSICDIAMASARELIIDKNPRLVEFALKTAGFNPVTKVESEVKNNIVINVE